MPPLIIFSESGHAAGQGLYKKHAHLYSQVSTTKCIASSQQPVNMWCQVKDMRHKGETTRAHALRSSQCPYFPGKCLSCTPHTLDATAAASVLLCVASTWPGRSCCACCRAGSAARSAVYMGVGGACAAGPLACCSAWLGCGTSPRAGPACLESLLSALLLRSVPLSGLGGVKTGAGKYIGCKCGHACCGNALCLCPGCACGANMGQNGAAPSAARGGGCAEKPENDVAACTWPSESLCLGIGALAAACPAAPMPTTGLAGRRLSCTPVAGIGVAPADGWGACTGPGAACAASATSSPLSCSARSALTM